MYILERYVYIKAHAFFLHMLCFLLSYIFAIKHFICNLLILFGIFKMYFIKSIRYFKLLLKQSLPYREVFKKLNL